MGRLQQFWRRVISPPATGSPTFGSHDLSWLCPPSTTTEPAPWDKFWKDQIDRGVAGLYEMFIYDGTLVDVMRAAGLKTVLCIGSGVSQEPRVLAAAGFDVTACDLSPYAMSVADSTEPTPKHLTRVLEGRDLRPGGQLRFVAGDVRDATCCPGPFDVVIDRRTLQLFSDAERPSAIEGVARRMGPRGIFFSQCHDGGCRPPAAPRHVTRDWFVEQGWPTWRTGAPITGRVAWFLMTTG